MDSEKHSPQVYVHVISHLSILVEDLLQNLSRGAGQRLLFSTPFRLCFSC